MLTLLLNSLKPTAKKVATAQSIFIVVILLYSFNQYDQLKTERARLQVAEASLANPKTIEVIKTVIKQGPVRFITRYVERPDGSKESFSEELYDAYSETSENKAESEPVAVDKLIAPIEKPRQSRFLVGLDLKDFSPNSYKNYTLYGGYSFVNRFDLLAGARLEDDDVEPHIMSVLRF